MNALNDRCDLCGLPLPKRCQTLSHSTPPLHFCCVGCRMVYTMLSEAAEAPDPSSFKETGLYKECLAAGIIPGSVEEQAALAENNSISGTPEAVASDTRQPAYSLPLSLEISGMWCPACAWVIETVAGKIPGVDEISCNFATDRLRCRYDPTTTSPEPIIKAVGKLGYTAIPADGRRQKGWRHPEFIRLMISILLTANVMMLSFALYSGFFTDLDAQGIRNISWPVFLMTAVIFLYGGRPIFRKAWGGIRAGAPGMEALIAMGASCAFAYSIYNFLHTGIHLYFDTTAMLITLVLLGKTLEQKAKSAIQVDLDGFFTLRPRKVRLLSSAFPRGRYVSARQLTQGDRFQVEADEVVAADGVVLSGSGSVDESAITGESRPIGMKPGRPIKSGTRIIDGSFTIRAERVGSQALLGRMIQTMQQALDRKVERESETDRILRWFVPVIVMLALFTGGVVMALTGDEKAALVRSVTVMVIACPCALGIAIPLARVAGIAIAAKRGMLVRRFRAFELAGKADHFVMDKTGTLTLGRWALVQMVTVPAWTEDRILALAAGLETGSDHVIAVELKQQAGMRGITPSRFDHVEICENGLRGVRDGKEVKIGSAAFLETEIKQYPRLKLVGGSDMDIHISKIYLSIDGRLAAIFGFGDRLKAHAADTVAFLKDRGIATLLVSGDEPETVNAVAEQLDISRACGGMLPEDKAALIAELGRSGAVTAMVGDGINDAPALAAADLSMALYSGYPLGKDTADVTFMRGDPGQVPEFLEFSRRVEKKIHQNLWASFAYNLISIPIAMSGLLTPLVAVAAMLLSSLSVTGNMLRFMKRERRLDL